ncbi:MAG: LemA family protein [Nitrospinales bacterium]
MIEIILVIGLFVFVSVIAYTFMIYNNLISLKENIKKAWANIDVILKQRHDEIPKLISVCESFTQFEKGILDRLMKARENYFGAKSVSKKAAASGEVSAALGGLFAISENYPEIKSNEHFMNLQNRISHLEETLADRREFYNDSTNNYNIRIQQIPDVIVARFLNYQSEELFQVSEQERQDVKIDIKLPKFD